jgi:hypothetical protein
MLPQTPTIKSLWFDVRQLDKDRCQRTAENEKIDKRPDFLHRPEILKHDILATRKSVYATLSNCLPRRRRVLQQLNRRCLPSDYMKRNDNAIFVAGRAIR